MSRNPGAGIRTLPADLDAERSLLGAILVHNLAFEQVARLVSAGDFFRDAHQRIYAAMATLFDGRTAVDEVTLKDELARRGELAECGGPIVIAKLADGVPDGTNAVHYAGIIKEKAQLRRIIAAGNAMTAAAYEAQEPSADLIAAADRSLLDLQHGYANGSMRSLHGSSQDRVAALEWRVEHKGELRGVETGYPLLNDLTLGWRPGALIIIAARTSIGKTTLALNCGVHAARTGAKVAVFSMEMEREQLESRIMAQLSGVDESRIQSGHVGSADWTKISSALEEMHGLPISIDDRAGLTALDIRSSCRRMVAEGLGLVIVDYVQIMGSGTERRGANKNEVITDNVDRLKAMAKELQVPVLVLSQLKRDEGKPKLSDLRESGSLEQVADIVLFLHRAHSREGGYTEMTLAKQRNGRTGSGWLYLNADTVTFTDGGDGPAHGATEPKDEKTAKDRSFWARRKAGGW